MWQRQLVKQFACPLIPAAYAAECRDQRVRLRIILNTLDMLQHLCERMTDRERQTDLAPGCVCVRAFLCVCCACACARVHASVRKRTRERESSTRKTERRRLIERGLKIACKNQLTYLSTCVKEQARERMGRKKQKKHSYILDRESTCYKRHAIFYAHVWTQMLYVYVCWGGEESKVASEIQELKHLFFFTRQSIPNTQRASAQVYSTICRSTWCGIRVVAHTLQQLASSLGSILEELAVVLSILLVLVRWGGVRRSCQNELFWGRETACS